MIKPNSAPIPRDDRTTRLNDDGHRDRVARRHHRAVGEADHVMASEVSTLSSCSSA
jgi:hypothetical protein